jgi:hypothetical protein
MTGYFIEYIIVDENAYMSTIHTDFKNMNSFVNILRLSYEELKKRNIKYVIQTVTLDDWENILKNVTTWTIVSHDNKYELYDVRCDIDDFLFNIGKSLGL